MTEQIENQKIVYQGNLEDSRWKRLRLQILDRDQHRCRFCASQSDLQVHHRQYHRSKKTGEWSKPWEYHPFFLITVCDTCHFEGHQQFSIPTKEI
jgi:5-methylcytosine-specific restriction endonuclease McrA